MSKELGKHLPLTPTTYLILLSLVKPIHGYGIMQKVEKISDGEVILGAGTLYGALKKLEKERFIKKEDDSGRRKYYVLTNIGQEIVRAEYKRLKRMIGISNKLLANEGGNPIEKESM